MKLYNTLTRNIETIKPLQPPTVSVYTCGPTVYDYPHIGNWFTFIRYDLLVRTLRASNLQPRWVMNITDVGHLVSDADEGEDKLAKGAKREGKSAWEIAEFYSNYFISGLQRLNILKPDYLPKATEHIPEQIEMIEQLAAKGFTYVIDDGVYYDTSKFPSYADFARLDLDEQQAGSRIEVNPQKRAPTDFALWKFSPKDQQRDMEWDSPWGKGFPGWHIECSAMSRKYLGDTIDIHSGGIDHVPIHHTNEIAQSEAVIGKPLANYWMHTNHILIEGEKVAKSAGNGITLEDIEKRGYSLMSLRLLVLQSHYRSQSKFSWEELEAAENRLKRFRNFAVRRFQEEQSSGASFSPDLLLVNRFRVIPALQDDLNTPAALRELEALIDASENRSLSDEKFLIEPLLTQLDDLLGLKLLAEPDITHEQKSLILERESSRKNQDWARSDELRNNLAKQGIGIRDAEQQQATTTIWYRL